jgi:hypothetical protein
MTEVLNVPIHDTAVVGTGMIATTVEAEKARVIVLDVMVNPTHIHPNNVMNSVHTLHAVDDTKIHDQSSMGEEVVTLTQRARTETVVVTIVSAMTDRNEKISVTDVTTDQRVDREANRQIHLLQNVPHADLGTKIATQNLNTAKLVKRLKHPQRQHQIARRSARSQSDGVIKNANQIRKS